ncbi:uncharacterized protein LOC142321175 [Lycorma delicatula]|uniref:uncharacterized protein LOC142321175 n=1 Tax=Lycorma delicatula TaxID=130591 RepID=UPI003F51061C
MIPENVGTKKSKEHRTISLISHAAKIILRVTKRRLITKMEENGREEQFGFRKGKGTRDAAGLIRIIGKRCFDGGRGLNLNFIDMEKAFEKLQWVNLFEILKENRIDWKDMKLIREL